MNKQQQIEEMAIIISGSTEIDTIEYYNALIKAKQIYEIIFPEDSVVLTREEYESDLTAQYDVGYEFGRKETAEKILDLLVPDCKTCDENWHTGCLCLRATLAEKITKQFGVDIKE